MDKIEGGRVVHPSPLMTILAEGRPTTVPGKLNQGIRFTNGQYLDVGQHQSCLGNLLKCPHGITGSLWANFRRMDNNMYLLSSGYNGVNMYYKVTVN